LKNCSHTYPFDSSKPYDCSGNPYEYSPSYNSNFNCTQHPYFSDGTEAPRPDTSEFQITHDRNDCGLNANLRGCSAASNPAAGSGWYHKPLTFTDDKDVLSVDFDMPDGENDFSFPRIAKWYYGAHQWQCELKCAECPSTANGYSFDTIAMTKKDYLDVAMTGGATSSSLGCTSDIKYVKLQGWKDSDANPVQEVVSLIPPLNLYKHARNILDKGL